MSFLRSFRFVFRTNYWFDFLNFTFHEHTKIATFTFFFLHGQNQRKLLFSRFFMHSAMAFLAGRKRQFERLKIASSISWPIYRSSISLQFIIVHEKQNSRIEIKKTFAFCCTSGVTRKRVWANSFASHWKTSLRDERVVRTGVFGWANEPWIEVCTTTVNFNHRSVSLFLFLSWSLISQTST